MVFNSPSFPFQFRHIFHLVQHHQGTYLYKFHQNDKVYNNLLDTVLCAVVYVLS
jgi:hypothetical protein